MDNNNMAAGIPHYFLAGQSAGRRSELSELIDK